MQSGVYGIFQLRHEPAKRERERERERKKEEMAREREEEEVREVRERDIHRERARNAYTDKGVSEHVIHKASKSR